MMTKNPEELAEYWLDFSKEDLKSAKALLDAHRYTWCAFICQQALEKCLKAGYVKIHKEIPPYIHKLERLCQLLELTPPQDILDKLIETDKYYIATRYPTYKEAVNIKNLKKAEGIYENAKRIYKWFIENLKL